MADFDARMTALRTRFIAQAVREADELAQHGQARRWAAMGDICHGLAGRAGMFGFAALGDAARDVEEAIDAGLDGTCLRPLIDRLSIELARLPRS